jgi:hypothetical protein
MQSLWQDVRYGARMLANSARLLHSGPPSH